MVIHEQSGRVLVTPKEAAQIYGCREPYFRKLYQNGEIKDRYVESPRRVYYFLDEVQRLSMEKEEARKKRGGRPRKGDEAA